MTEALPEIGLMLLAAVAGLWIWWLARQEPLWQGASLGVLLGGLQIGAMLLEPISTPSVTFQPSGGLLLLGVLAWAATLRRLHPTDSPRYSLGLLPFVPFMVLGLLQGPGLELARALWLVDLLPLLLALPLLEAALRGQVGEGRLVWGLGLLFKAGGSLALAWLGEAGGFTYLAWAMSLLLLGSGIHLETHQERISKPILILIAAGLLSSLVLLSLDLQASNRFSEWVLIGWAYAAFTAITGVGLVVYQRILRSERQLELWVNLLETLSSKSQATQHLTPQGVLQSVLDGLKPLFSNLVGLEVRSDTTFRVGQSGPYVRTFELMLEHPTEARLYFSGPPQDERGLEALAPLLTERLRLSLTLNEWRSKAYTDPLTGLLNRRGFERQMQRLIRLAGEQGKPIALALLDIDRFKRVNDTYGHPAGDEVLKQLAGLLRKASRSDDLAVRLGGEEFGLVLFGADLEDAYHVLERIQSEVRSLYIPPISWPLSISAGLAGGEIPPSMSTVQRWLEQADEALYEAKKSGRDRIYPVPTMPGLEDLLEL
ncbi:GGDEF domain-containing protein [Meiothermus sp. CFH 77666]|uniref:GGDEF domain-containing protein n=1 Tax=Meiothermus sp. CFH 77666 TaxID=2817942 RepID=UPI001AA00D6F|nr:GGDEF domain-containing protein [Meiothermus sp. CFH 77666]MBO1438654.1 GGDEF domain-containing protein [Meiothermus sp. CFH 77666]